MKLKDYTKGWIVGNFEPSLFKTDVLEIAIKKYKSGEKETKHFHKIATEYTIVIFGTIKMLNTFYYEGDVVVVQPNVNNEFECIDDATLLVVKTPSITGDKYES